MAQSLAQTPQEPWPSRRRLVPQVVFATTGGLSLRKSATVLPLNVESTIRTRIASTPMNPLSFATRCFKSTLPKLETPLLLFPHAVTLVPRSLRVAKSPIALSWTNVFEG